MSRPLDPNSSEVFLDCKAWYCSASVRSRLIAMAQRRCLGHIAEDLYHGFYVQKLHAVCDHLDATIENRFAYVLRAFANYVEDSRKLETRAGGLADVDEARNAVPDEAAQPSENDPFHHYDRQRMLADLRDLLPRLPDQQYRILEDYYLDELSLQQIAAQEGISANAAAARLRRARLALRRLMKQKMARLVSADIVNWAQFTASLATGATPSSPSSLRRFWNLISRDTQHQILEAARSGDCNAETRERLIAELNWIITHHDLRRWNADLGPSGPRAAARPNPKGQPESTWWRNRLCFEMVFAGCVARGHWYGLLLNEDSDD